MINSWNQEELAFLFNQLWTFLNNNKEIGVSFIAGKVSHFYPAFFLLCYFPTFFKNSQVNEILNFNTKMSKHSEEDENLEKNVWKCQKISCSYAKTKQHGPISLSVNCLANSFARLPIPSLIPSRCYFLKRSKKARIFALSCHTNGYTLLIGEMMI